jgi:hypothetical protein
MPLHRQIDRYSKMDIGIPASNASDWLIKGWEQLQPLWKPFRLIVLCPETPQGWRDSPKSTRPGP